MEDEDANSASHKVFNRWSFLGVRTPSLTPSGSDTQPVLNQFQVSVVSATVKYGPAPEGQGCEEVKNQPCVVLVTTRGDALTGIVRFFSLLPDLGRVAGARLPAELRFAIVLDGAMTSGEHTTLTRGDWVEDDTFMDALQWISPTSSLLPPSLLPKKRKTVEKNEA